ncbi:MAG: oligosaccharide flippase family protein [Bacilli bacterium]|nr:oligosaccharide flippase family protein [Bacilli bacterium]
MKKSFKQSVIILLIGGLLTKILGMFIKIIMSRMLGTEGIGLYMMILPTFTLFISLAQFGMPIALSKLVAEHNRNNIKLFFSVLPISLLINLLLIFIIIIIAPYLSNNLLHDNRLLLSIISIAFVIPFTSISNICRAYFFGKQEMIPHVVSTVIEDIFRLILMIIGIPFFMNKGLKYALCYIILSNIISEITSILILIFFLPKNIKISKYNLLPKKNYIRESLSIGIPNTTGRLIGSIGYFLEPIILSTILLSVGYSNKYITNEYGIISGYVMPLLLLPSFFTLAISQALLPVVSKEYSKKNIKTVKIKIKQAIIYSLIIGIPITILFMITPTTFLKLIYNTNKGAKYIISLAPICLIQYIQAPLLSSLDAMGKSKDSMKATTIGVIIRTILLTILSLLKIKMWSLIISISMNVIIVTLYSIKKVKETLN